MADLLEGEFELDGYRFGTPDSDVIVLEGGFDTGAAELRTQYADNPVSDGGYFGRDYLSGPTWAFTLGVRDDENVYSTLAELARVWRSEEVRKTPGALSVLRFRRGGDTWRVYGRPRHFGISPGEVADDTWQIVDADFRVADPFMYRDEEADQVIPLIEPASSGGVVLPAVLPWELARNTNAGSRIIDVQSVEPAPFTLTIYGPQVGSLSKIRVAGDGWEFDLDTSIAYDDWIVIDTYAMTAKRKNGLSVAGALSRKSRLNARLQPGLQQITFTGTDPSNTARVRIAWRSTHPIL